MTEKDLENPTIKRSAEGMMAAHDVLGLLTENKSLFEDAIHPDTWLQIEGALDVLCWALGHNDTFDTVMVALARITSEKFPDIVIMPKEPAQ